MLGSANSDRKCIFNEQGYYTSRLNKLFEEYSDDKDANQPFHHPTGKGSMLGAGPGMSLCSLDGGFCLLEHTNINPFSRTPHTQPCCQELQSRGTCCGSQLCQPSTTPSTCRVKGNFKTFPSDRALPSSDTFWAQSTEGLHSLWTSLIKQNQLLKDFRKHFPSKDSKAAKAPNLFSGSTVDRQIETMNC